MASSKTILRYIVAFSFNEGNEDYNSLCHKLEDKGVWAPYDVWIDGVEQDIYDYILNQLENKDSRTNIGTSWLYKPEGKLPSITYHSMDLGKGEYHTLPLTQIGLFLFRSKVGFLWYEIDGTEISNSSDKLISFQNTFKELNRSNNRKRYMLLDESGAEHEFLLGEFLNEILQELPCKINYFSRRSSLSSKSDSGKKFVPDKSILFTYYTADTSTLADDALPKIAYYLSRGYNLRYKMPLDVTEQMFHPFENVFWDITNEGCACCSTYSDDNRIFFTEGFLKKICSDYFILYILLLHQSYSLLNYATRIEKELSAEPSSYIENLQTSRKTVESLQLELNTFFTKNIYTSVSHIQHQNEFYSFGVKKLRIEENIQSVNLGTDAIGEILVVHENRREAETDSRRSMWLGILSVLVIFSALTDAASLFDVPWSERVHNPLFVLVMGFIAAIIVTVIFIIIKNIFKSRKKGS